MIFYSYLDSVINVSSDLKTELAKIAKRKIIEKGETLIQIGERCNDIYFIENGLLRGYYFLEEKEIYGLTNILFPNNNQIFFNFKIVIEIQCLKL